MFVMAANLGLATLLVSDQFFQIRRSWRSEERCTRKRKNKRRGCSKVYKGNTERCTQEPSKESQGRSCCEVQHDARGEDAQKKAFDGDVCPMALSRKTEKKGITNFSDVARMCVWIPKKQGRCKKEDFSISRREGDQQFTQDGRGAEITIDLVLQSREKMSDNRVNGPEDAVVSEMIKQLPQEKIHIITR